ncbi:MAG TPA: hypothetical protein DCF63_11855 [Planctomycetaceae bacterium]|nr:hypothetical protein [Planctomycetaceae bacterium]
MTNFPLHKFRRLAVPIVILSVVWTSTTGARAALLYRLTDLGQCTLTNDAAQDITEGGKVGLQQDGLAYAWSAGNLTPAAGLPNNHTIVCVNDMESIAGSHNFEAFLWNNGTKVALGSLEGGWTFCSDINDLNQVIGISYRSSINRYRGFLWQNGSMVEIGGFLPNGRSRPTAISNSGRIVGYATTATTELPFVYDGGTISALPILPGYVRGEAYGLSSNGRNIAGTSRKNYFFDSEATAWIDGRMVALGRLDFSVSTALDVNDWGQVVGSVGYSNDPRAAFLWQNGVMYNLNSLLTNAPGYYIREVFSINNFGQIVGYAYYGEQKRSVLLSPVPEPSTLGLTAAGLVLCLVCARRKQRSVETA